MWFLCIKLTKPERTQILDKLESELKCEMWSVGHKFLQVQRDLPFSIPTTKAALFNASPEGSEHQPTT